MAQLTYAELEGYWINAGGSTETAPIAAAIALAESSGDPSAVQQGQPYETTGWGLWQITPGNSVPNVGVDNALLDPAVNAKAAIAKYQGSGNTFRPWTTYTGGKYMEFLQTNVPPVTTSEDPTFLTGNTVDPSAGESSGQVETPSESILGKLTDGSWWKRVGMMALALLLGLVSVSYLFFRSPAGKKTEDTAKTAATAAAMA